MIYIYNDIEIIQKYKDGLSLKNISNIYNLAPNTIKKILLKNNIELRSRAGNKGMFLKKDYFSNINTEYKAYFIGLLLADGNVYLRNNGQPCIRITLEKTDKYILEKLKEELNTSNQVTLNRGNEVTLSIHSEKIFNDLKKYSIFPNKTFKKFFPKNIPYEYMNHFLRGFFDGNGCISINKPINRVTYRKQLSFCDNEELLIGIREFLTNELNTRFNKINTRKNISQLFYCSKEDVEKISNYMYKNSTIYMIRKYEKLKSN